MRRIEREGGVELLMQILTKYGLEHESNAVAQNLFKSLQMEDTVNWEDISLIRKIGEGKYGDVYKVSRSIDALISLVTHRRVQALYHGFPVACKIIKKELQERDAESTLEELRLMK